MAAWHVLPDEQPQLVAPIIPAVRLHLHMLTCHVETKLLRNLNIVTKSLIGRSGVKAIRPESLVERTDHEIRFVVKENARNALLVFAQSDFAHTDIAGDLINRYRTFFQGDGEFVQKWLLRGPKFWVFDRKGDFASSRCIRSSNGYPSRSGHEFNGGARSLAVQNDVQLQSLLI